MTKQIYFSIDIETNGLAAGIHSMISLGVAAINMKNGDIVASYKWNLKPLPDLKVDKDTMEWWTKFPDAYLRATENAMDAEEAIKQFDKWVRYVCEIGNIDRPVCAAWKPGFDVGFLRYYLHRFCGHDIFGRAGSGLDIKTLTAIALGQPFSETQIGTVPDYLKGSKAEHNHDALDDAIEQATVMYNACKVLRSYNLPGNV